MRSNAYHIDIFMYAIKVLQLSHAHFKRIGCDILGPYGCCIVFESNTSVFSRQQHRR